MNRWRKRQDGFTLVELMIVVMIIAILMAIAIPTFLSTRQKAQDQAAKSNLRNALSTAQSIYSDKQDYSTVTPAAMSADEPSMTFQTAASTGPKIISVATASDRIILAVKSASGTCWAMRHVVTAGAADSGTMIGKGSCDAASIGSVTFEAP